MTPFFVEKGTELFEALLIGLRSKRNSSIPDVSQLQRNAISLFPHFLSFSLPIQLPLPSCWRQTMEPRSWSTLLERLRGIKTVDAPPSLDPVGTQLPIAIPSGNTPLVMAYRAGHPRAHSPNGDGPVLATPLSLSLLRAVRGPPYRRRRGGRSSGPPSQRHRPLQD